MAEAHNEHPEYKAKNAEEATKEMMPFAIYAIVPIAVTIFIAFYFGSK